MDQLPLALPNTPPSRRRGRPPGAKSKRSLDLAKYVEARFAGMTPGQQLAELAMVTRAEISRAGGLQDAMAAKAVELSRALSCDPKEAMAIVVKALTELMPYVHQKRPIAVDAKVQQLPTMFVVSEGDMAPSLAGAPHDDQAADIIDGFLAGEGQVGNDKSDDAP
jgi:hypothetical protein